MNNTYNIFINSNLHALLDIYQKEIVTHKSGCLVIKINDKKETQVFFQSKKRLSSQVKELMKAIKSRDPILLQKDRHVFTYQAQKNSFPIKEVFFLLTEPKEDFLLRGYQQQLHQGSYCFEFETFRDKTIQLYHWNIEKTSAGSQYLALCQDAVSNDAVFKTFRSNLAYQNIVIAGDEKRHRQYIEKFLKNNEESAKYIQDPAYLNKLMECDQIGSPPTHPLQINQNNEIKLSTYTLRCLNTFLDIKRYFPEITQPNIVEIGSAHGGLCHLISQLMEYKSYTLIDVPPVNMLAEKYLTNAKISSDNKIRYMNSEQIIPRKYDILISEYTVSELDFKALEYYLQNVIQYCQTAYLAMNVWEPEQKALYHTKIAKYFSKIDEYPEDPGSQYANYIWVCKK